MSANRGKKGENKLHCLNNQLDIWQHKVTALLDDPKKAITPKVVKTFSNEILQFLWTRELVKKEDIILTITTIEPATSPKRVCSPVRQTPSSADSGLRSRPLSRPRHAEAQDISVCDDVKVTLRFEEDDIQTIIYDQKEYEQIKSENADLKKELESLGRHFEYLQQQREHLEFQVELLTTEKSTLSLEAQKKYKTLEDAFTKRYKAERINDIDESEKVRARRYRAQRNLALLENKELIKQIDELTNVESDVQQKDLEMQSLKYRIEGQSQYIQEIQKRLTDVESDVQQKDMEMQSLKHRIEGQSQYIQEIQKSAEEDKNDANIAIVNYKEEEQRYKKARDQANDKIAKLTKEKDEIFAKVNRDIAKIIAKITTEKDETLSLLQKQKRVNQDERQRHKQSEETLSKELYAVQIKLENEQNKNGNRDREDIQREERSHTKLFEENEELKKEILEMQKRHTLEDYQKETLDKKNEELVTLTRKRYELEEELKFSNERKSVIEMAYEEMKTKFQNMSQKLQESDNRYTSSGNKRLSDIEKENESLSKELTMSLKTIEKSKQDYKILEKKNEIERSKYRETLSQIQAELNSKKIQEFDQRETSRTLDHEKQNLTSKMYSLENDNIELHDRIRKAEANMKQMQIIRDENERLKASLSEMRRDVIDLEAKYKTQTKGKEDTITNLKDEGERLRKDMNIARKETERITREKDILTQELQTEIIVAKSEHEKLRKEKNELIVLFKEESKKDKDKINKLEKVTQTFHNRYKQEAEIMGTEDITNKLKMENDRYRKERNAARTDLHQMTKDNQELKSEIQAVNDEYEQLKKKKTELVSVFKVESEKNKNHTDKLEREVETLRGRSSSGEKAKQYNSYELMRLKNDYEICKKQKAEADENLADLQQENKELENTLKELESKHQHCMKCDEYERKLNKLKKDHQELQDRYNIASTDIHIARRKLEELSSEVKEGKQETAKVTEVLEKIVKEKRNLDSQLRELESSRNDSASGEVISLQRQINTLQSKNAELNQRCQHQNKVQQEADNDKRKLHSRISQLESNITEIKQDKDTLISRVEILREEKSDLEERLRRRSPQVVLDPRNCQNCWKYRNDISDLKREVNDLRDRLSEAAGNRLRDNNPNIADLSDMNRPTSLAEKFGSLYTDEYTDAMEVIEDDMDEKAVVDLMLQWLQGCYDWCEKLAKEQRNLLTKESVGFMQKYCGTHIDLALSDKCYIFVKEFQKKIAVDTLSPVGKICNEKSVKEERLSSDSRIIKYLKKCTDLCWMMQIADPPMYLHFEIQQGQNLDKNYYNVFTKSGSTIDFLVWPVLKLHRNGPMLAKGVAQGK